MNNLHRRVLSLSTARHLNSLGRYAPQRLRPTVAVRHPRRGGEGEAQPFAGLAAAILPYSSRSLSKSITTRHTSQTPQRLFLTWAQTLVPVPPGLRNDTRPRVS
jgi:hypothetical protein